MAKCNIAGVDDCNDGWPCITIDQSDKKSGLVAPKVEEPVARAPGGRYRRQGGIEICWL